MNSASCSDSRKWSDASGFLVQYCRTCIGGKWPGNRGEMASMLTMIEFFLPNSRAILPTFQTNCPHRSHFSQMGSDFAQNTTSKPCSCSVVTNSFLGYVPTQNTPKPTPKHLFSLPDFESGKNDLLSGQNGPHLGEMCEKWAKLFKKWAKKYLFLCFMSAAPWVWLSAGATEWVQLLERGSMNAA